ncbi:MAG: septation regulator SpoVG [Lachnospiraceae bacterium]|nr:septation regulator SpoVG [Lachnospiraceae bacterium]
MNITDVRIRKITKEGNMKAVASVTLDNEFAIHDIKIIEGEKGLFMAMPSRKTPEGEYRDIAHPISHEAREMLQKAVLEGYENILNAPEEI